MAHQNDLVLGRIIKKLPISTLNAQNGRTESSTGILFSALKPFKISYLYARNNLMPLRLYYYQGWEQLRQFYNHQISEEKQKQILNGNKQIIQNYYYPNYPYLMNLPIVFPNQILSPFSFSQKIFPTCTQEQTRDRTSNLKVEQKELHYAQTKQDLITLPFDSTSKPKCGNSLNKKTETDSFTEKRNIVPNNINHILAFVQRKSKSESLLKKLIKQHGGLPKYTSKRFYCYQSQLKEKLHVHVNKDTLKKLISHLDLHSELFTIDQQLFYNRLCRILICYYLREVARITILSSGRVKQTNKKDHLKAQRELLDFMLHIDCSQ